MKGLVDHGGRSLLEIELDPSAGGTIRQVTAWIDTGFTGELVLPRTLIEELALPQSGLCPNRTQ